MECRFVIFIVIILNGNILEVESQEANDPALIAKAMEGQTKPQGNTPAGAGVAGQRSPAPPSTIKTKKKRTLPPRVSLEEDCDYLAYYCMKAYKTGKVCGRTIYYKYHNFENYCMLDYVNCMERYEVWQVVHMGECFELVPLEDYQHYEYHDDLFLDQIYVIQD